MGERLATFFPLLLLVLLAALTYWLDRAVQSPAAPRETVVRHDPDYTVEKMLATRMGVNGRVRDTLHAAHMAHFPDDDIDRLLALYELHIAVDSLQYMAFADDLAGLESTTDRIAELLAANGPIR